MSFIHDYLIGRNGQIAREFLKDNIRETWQSIKKNPGKTLLSLIGLGSVGILTYEAANPRNSAAQAFSKSKAGVLEQAPTRSNYQNLETLLPAGKVAVDNELFGPATNYSVGDRPQSIDIGDLENGYNSIVSANMGSDSLSVRLNNGDGTFGPKKDYGGIDGPLSSAIGRLDEDEYNDIAGVGFVGKLLIYSNNGDGTFTLKGEYDAGTSLYSVVIRDFDGDGHNDVGTTVYSRNSVLIFWGNGDGTFPSRNEYSTGGEAPVSMDSRDLNGDGLDEIGVANYKSNSASILWGNDDWTFTVAGPYDMGGRLQSIDIDL